MLASIYCAPKRMWGKMHDLVYLAGVFSWATKSPPLLSLCTCEFLILLVTFCSENITCSKRNNLKKNPLEEKPHSASLADNAGHCFAPGSRYPTATTVPSMAFPGHPICSVQLCTWSRTCWWLLTPLPTAAGSCRVFCFHRSPPGPFLFPSLQMQLEEISARWLCPSCRDRLGTALWLSCVLGPILPGSYGDGGINDAARAGGGDVHSCSSSDGATHAGETQWWQW